MYQWEFWQEGKSPIPGLIKNDFTIPRGKCALFWRWEDCRKKNRNGTPGCWEWHSIRRKDELPSSAAHWRHLDGQLITDFCIIGRWDRLQYRLAEQRMPGRIGWQRWMKQTAVRLSVWPFLEWSIRMPIGIWKDHTDWSEQTGRKIIPRTEPCEFFYHGCDSDRKRKMLDEAVSPTVAPRRAEASLLQNDSSSAVKTDSGAVWGACGQGGRRTGD